MILGIPQGIPFNPHHTTITMRNFNAAAAKLEITVDEILEMLNLTIDEAKEEDLSVDEIIEACEDSGFEYDDWFPFGDSCSQPD